MYRLRHTYQQNKAMWHEEPDWNLPPHWNHLSFGGNAYILHRGPSYLC
jgi:hypothetical protein